MSTSTTATGSTHRAARVPSNNGLYMNDGLSPKKTAFIIVTVIGCIAILWPKVFYPMMFGDVAAPKPNIKDTRHGGVRQERHVHLHPESIYQAMRERGRAIPVTPTIPIVEKKKTPSNPPPRIVEGRPGPIPGMRPPMGAGALHQPQAKGSSMGFIMPLYTIGIIIFFGYTIMKIVFKKPIPNAPYGPAPVDPTFRKEVFEPARSDGRHIEELNGSKFGTNNDSELYNASLSAVDAASRLQQRNYQQQQQLRAQQQEAAVADLALGAMSSFNKDSNQLLEIEKLRMKLEDTERAMAKLIADMNSDQLETKL